VTADYSRRRRAGLLVVAVAVVVRVAAWFELRDSALLELERWPDSEMHYVDAQARAVIGGDLLLRSRIDPPDAGFLCAARAGTEPPAARCTDPATSAALRRWPRTPAYWNPPLYPYLVAAVYAAAGPDPRMVMALQALAGVMSCWFVLAIAARLFDERAAVAAGLIAALLGTGLYYETLLAGAACAGLAALATLYALLRALESQRPFAAALCAGLAGAAAALLSTVALIVVPVTFAAALAMRLTRSAQRRWSTTAGFAAGLACGAALVLALPFARNLAVGAPALPIATRIPVDFVMGNTFGATATARAKPSAATTAIFAARAAEPATSVPVDVAAGAAAIETADILAALSATVATHPSSADWLWLVAAKFAAFWRWYEIPVDANYYYFTEHLPIVSRFLIGWSMMAGFVALGLLSGIRKGLPVLLPVVWILATASTCALLFNLSSLRFPAVLVAAPLAGQGIATLIEFDRRRRYLIGLPALVFAIAISNATLARWEVPFGPIRTQYYDVANNLAVAVAEEKYAEGRTDQALTTVRKQLRSEPQALRAVKQGGELALDPWIAVNARSFEAVYRSEARYAAALGDDEGAREAAQHADVLGAVVEQWKTWPGH